jgi:hypothetical protein
MNPTPYQLAKSIITEEVRAAGYTGVVSRLTKDHPELTKAIVKAARRLAGEMAENQTKRNKETTDGDGRSTR